MRGFAPPMRPKRSLIPADDELDADCDEVSAAGSVFGAVFGAVFLVAITVKLSTQRHVDA